MVGLVAPALVDPVLVDPVLVDPALLDSVLDNLSQQPVDVRGSADIYASNFAGLRKVRIGSDFPVACTIVHTCWKSSHSPPVTLCDSRARQPITLPSPTWARIFSIASPRKARMAQSPLGAATLRTKLRIGTATNYATGRSA